MFQYVNDGVEYYVCPVERLYKENRSKGFSCRNGFPYNFVFMKN